MALDRGSFWHLEWGVISAVPGTMDQIQLAQGPETLTGVAGVRNPGCKEEKLTNCSVMKGKSVYWFMTLKIHGCLASRIAAHNSSFLQLDSAFFCIDHILRQILCHAERPPEEAGFSSVMSHSVVSDSLRPHELQHARPPCPSPTPRVHSDSRPLSQ